jgi:hypothetical protein
MRRLSIRNPDLLFQGMTFAWTRTGLSSVQDDLEIIFSAKTST